MHLVISSPHSHCQVLGRHLPGACRRGRRVLFCFSKVSSVAFLGTLFPVVLRFLPRVSLLPSLPGMRWERHPELRRTGRGEPHVTYRWHQLCSGQTDSTREENEKPFKCRFSSAFCVCEMKHWEASVSRWLFHKGVLYLGCLASFSYFT